MNIYDYIYLLSNVFGTYTIYKFINVFFNRRTKDNRYVALSFVAYYIIIGYLYIAFNIPILNLLCNLVLFYLLTLNYESGIKARITAVAYIYAILISVEAITIIIISLLDFSSYSSNINIELVLAQILSKILPFIVVIVISNFKKHKDDYYIPPLHWIATFLIPLGTLSTTYLVMIQIDGRHIYRILFSIAFLFIINIFVFYLYEVLLESYHEKMEKNLLQLQNNAYIKQLDIINQAQTSLRIAKHDMKNHVSALQILIENDRKIPALQYIKDIYEIIDNKDLLARSGNSDIDSILNYKISEAKDRGIKVNINLHIPNQLNIQTFDLVAIIGNLFDNAIEAVSKLKEDKQISVSIELDRNVIYIYFTNSYSGELQYSNHNLLTTHKDAKNHGLGLLSVKKSIEKYNGIMNISHMDNTFNVEVLLYNITMV